MKRVLILGGSYFVGKMIVDEFLRLGYDVSILNRGTKQEIPSGIHQISCDRDDLEQMKQVLAGQLFECVVDVSWKDINWVKNLSEALELEYVKQFVFLSSSAVYDVEHLQIPYAEEDPLAENKYWTFYGAGKIEAENYYINLFENTGTKLLIIRPPYVYGEYNYAQRESLMFRQIIEHKPVIIPKSNPKLQFIHGRDLAADIALLVQQQMAPLEIYNVGNEESVTAREWAEACSQAVGEPAVILECDYQALGIREREFYPFFDYDNVLDVRKIHAIIPQEIPFLEGLKQSYHWFLEEKEKIRFKESVDRMIEELIQKLS